MLFQKKPAAENELKLAPSSPPIRVETIPADFYAGANPVIKFKNIEQEVDVRKTNALLSPADKSAFDQANVPGAIQLHHPAVLFSHHRSLLYILVGAFLVFVGIGGFYFFVVYKPAVGVVTISTSTVAVSTSSLPGVIVPVENTVSSTLDVTTTPSTDASSTQPVVGTKMPIEFPSILLGDSTDADNDGLTDKEEGVFKTDPGIPDTDGDSYTDGHEVYNLYNPEGKTPMRIIESGLVKEFINPQFSYKLYYPIGWIEDTVDTEYRQILFSTASGEHIEIRTFDRENDDIDFQAWFSKWGKDQKLEDILSFDGALKQSGFRRKDYMAYYFMDDQRVYVILYHPSATENSINYRTVIKMMARSFHFGPSTAAVIPNALSEKISGELASVTSSVSSSVGTVLNLGSNQFFTPSTTTTTLDIMPVSATSSTSPTVTTTL